MGTGLQEKTGGQSEDDEDDKYSHHNDGTVGADSDPSVDQNNDENDYNDNDSYGQDDDGYFATGCDASGCDEDGKCRCYMNDDSGSDDRGNDE